MYIQFVYLHLINMKPLPIEMLTFLKNVELSYILEKYNFRLRQ